MKSSTRRRPALRPRQQRRTAAEPAEVAAPDPSTLGRSRDNPASAACFSAAAPAQWQRRRRRRPGISISISRAAGLDYVVGDSFRHLCVGTISVTSTRSSLCSGASQHRRRCVARRCVKCCNDDVSLAPAPDSLFELMSYLTGGAQRAKARALAQGEDPRWRCRDARRDGCVAEILRRAAASGSFHRGA